MSTSALVRARADAIRAATDAQDTIQAAGENVTDAQIKAAEDAVARVKDLDAKITRMDGLSSALSSVANTTHEVDDYDPGDLSGFKSATTIGERYIKSDAYRSFQKANPAGLGEGTPLSMPRVKIGDMGDFMANRKADGALLGTPIAHTPTLRLDTVDMVERRPLTLLDIIGRGRMAGAFDYVQIVSTSNNAAIVPEATTVDEGLKPTSDMETQLADCKPFTFADGFTVTNALLSDAPAFASYMQTSLSYNLDSVIEGYVLNGAGGSEPQGILRTTGVQEQPYTPGSDVMDLVKAVRRAKARLRAVGGVATAVLVNPEDEASIDLLQDTTNRFFGQGPFGVGPATLWGVPVVSSEVIEQGTALIGDFKQVQLLDREGLSVTAFNQHKDYAQRNLVYVRAELRAGVTIWRPNRLCLVKAA